jgi:hypothetical protein
MDPFTQQHLAHIRQQEILDQAALDQDKMSLREIAEKAGDVLITVGQKLMRTARPTSAKQMITAQTTTDNC